MEGIDNILSEKEYQILGYFQYRPNNIIEIASEIGSEVEKPLEIIENLIKKGMLTYSGARVVLSSKTTTYDLQKILSVYNLPKSGSKKALIDRIIENNLQEKEEVKELIINVANITNSGELAIKLYENNMEIIEEEELEKDKKTKQEVISNIISLYLSGKTRGAYKIASDYWKQFTDQAQYLFLNGSDTRKLLASVERSKPGSLADLPNEEINKYRAATFAIILMNQESSFTNISTILEKFRYLDINPSEIGLISKRINHIIVNSRYHRFKKSFEDQSLRHFLFSVEYDDYVSCELCRTLDKKTISITEFPELPLEGCQCDEGCNINIKAIFEEDLDAEDEDDENNSNPQSDIQKIKNHILRIHKQIEKTSEKYKIIDTGLIKIGSDLDQGIIDEITAEDRLEEILKILES